MSQPSLTTHDRELASVLKVRIEPDDLNLRPLTPQSVTLPTLPRAGLITEREEKTFHECVEQAKLLEQVIRDVEDINPSANINKIDKNDVQVKYKTVYSFFSSKELSVHSLWN